MHNKFIFNCFLFFKNFVSFPCIVSIATSLILVIIVVSVLQQFRRSFDAISIVVLKALYVVLFCIKDE